MDWCNEFHPLNVLAVMIGMAGLLMFLGTMCVAICFAKGDKNE